MRSAQQLKDLGIPSWYHGHARYYERLFTNLGWNERQITEALKFGANYQGDGSEEHLTKQFEDLAAIIDAPDIDLSIGAGLGLRDSILSGGIESLPALEVSAPAFSSADETRLASIREMRRNDPDSYDRDTALHSEEFRLIEASIQTSAPVSTGSDSAASVQPASTEG